MEGVQIKKGYRKRVAQLVFVGEPVAGNHHLAPYPSTVPSRDGEDAFISIQQPIPYKQTTFEADSMVVSGQSDANTSLAGMLSEDNIVVDMGAGGSQLPMDDLVSSVRSPGLLDQAGVINWRRRFVVMEDLTDLQVAGLSCEMSEKQGGFIKHGGEEDVIQLLKRQMPEGEEGVICNPQVLSCVNGCYDEGKEYEVNPNASSKGANGVATMCQDVRSGKTFIRKKVDGEVSKNEIVVPLMLKDVPGIPEVYGITRKGETTEIFQEFAGLSLEKLWSMNSEYLKRLRDPKTFLGLAYQGFRTLEKLHSHNIQHLDIKPENVCVEAAQTGVLFLKLIDFGSCQLPGEVVTDGFTYEYLSPESCRTVAKISWKRAGMLPAEVETGCLQNGADVWAMTLTLMYCLYGYHIMVYASTGQVTYPATNADEMNRLRMQCLAEISKMTDAKVASLISPKLPDYLRELFTNTLRVNPEQRWSAGQAADFIMKCLIAVSSDQKMHAEEPPSLVSTSIAASPMVRLRPKAAQNLSPWINQALPGNPATHDLQEYRPTQPCKRRCLGGEPSVYGYKIIRKQ